MSLASTRRLPPLDPGVDPDPPETESSQPPAWEEWFPAAEGEFVFLLSFPSLGGALAVKAVLESENVPCKISPPHLMSVLFAPRIDLFVDARLAHRARFLLDHDISDAELCFLATGELGTGE